ncbi:MAG: DUF1501 domain-containing protein [Rhodothermales bacterium]
MILFKPKTDALVEEAARETVRLDTRRHFLRQCTTGLGAIALGSLLTGCGPGSTASTAASPLTMGSSHFAPRAKRVIFLHMAGAPSQLELFDYKPELAKLHGQDCPPSLLEGKRFAFIKGVPQMLGPQATFRQHGESRAWVSDLMPHLGSQADHITFLKAMHTDEFNHAPAQLLMHSGSPRLGRPSMGSWVTYGLGSENDDLPGYMVLLSGGNQPDAGRSVFGSGFLPTVYQGVQCRSEGDPVLYVSNPDGTDRALRRRALDALNTINEREYQQVGDPEILTRMAQYEMAFRMQISVPEVMTIEDEPAYIHDLYGTTPGETSFANNCLLARRLVEHGVRFVQLFDWGWDTHGGSPDNALNGSFIGRTQKTDRALSGLLTDLEQRGLLDDTLVVWGGEFGRTPMKENRAGTDTPHVGRDHHSEAFTMWMAGGGVKRGFSYGETDEIGYYGIKDRVHIHDLQATILHLMGLNHERLTYPFQGRDFRLTDVHGHVIEDILA